MKNRQLFFFFLFSILATCIKANDGAYLGSGSQLVPITDSDITVKKEILSIIRNTQNDRLVDVSVYYEFYNPGKEKTITIGFEATSPWGDAKVSPEKGQHPYITDFSINVNNKELPYEVAIVKDSIYYNNGILNKLTSKEIKSNIEEYDGEYADFFYVYYFDTTINPGINIIKHTYTYELSNNVMNIYMFDYVLTAAMRWGNKQIDDFTLNINMGDYQEINIPKTFFDDALDWTIEGIGRTSSLYDKVDNTDETNNTLIFYIQKGKITFKKKNFSPKGELSFYSPRGLLYSDTFNYAKDESFPFNYSFYYEDLVPADNTSQKILRNLPFAYRGYVFSTPAIQKYYEQQFWYNADPLYKAEIDSLFDDEREWVDYWTKYKIK